MIEVSVNGWSESPHTGNSVSLGELWAQQFCLNVVSSLKIMTIAPIIL